MSKGYQRGLARTPFGQENGFRRVRIPVNSASVVVTATSTAVGFGTAVLGAFPEGYVLYAGGVANLAFVTADTDVVVAFEGQYALGTTADANGTLATTEVDLIAATDITADARVVPATIGHHTNSSGASSLQLIDNSAGTAEVNLNVTIDAADITDDQAATLTVNGYVDLILCVIGDE